LTGRELLTILDSELAQLPARVRAPLVLCYLEGMARDEAARQLNCPLGTLKSRLERGRELLRRQLARKGFTLREARPALLGVSAHVPPQLFEVTLQATMPFAAGTVMTVRVAPHVLFLAQGALRLAAGGSWKIVAVLLLFLVSLGATGLGLLFHSVPENEFLS